MMRKIVLGLTLAAFACIGTALAEGIKRTPLQKIDFPEGYVTISGIAEIPAGGSAGAHTHPGIEMGYVLEGEGDLIIEAQPMNRHVKAGDSWVIPAGVLHDAKAGDKPLKVLAVYVVDKNKPLATPKP